MLTDREIKLLAKMSARQKTGHSVKGISSVHYRVIRKGRGFRLVREGK